MGHEMPFCAHFSVWKVGGGCSEGVNEIGQGGS